MVDETSCHSLIRRITQAKKVIGSIDILYGSVLGDIQAKTSPKPNTLTMR